METLDLKIAELGKCAAAFVNISADDLKTQCTGLEREKRIPLVDYVESQGERLRKELPSESEYLEYVSLYFPSGKDSKVIRVISAAGPVVIPLSLEKYGFPEVQSVDISPYHKKFHLSERAEQSYQSLLSSTSHKLNTLLERVASSINDSIEYDVDRFLRYLGPEEQVDLLEDFDYEPTGYEVQKGICSDAGRQIRSMLRSLGLPTHIAAVHVSTHKSPRPYTHDTTTVFDKCTGHWAVLNSKSTSDGSSLVSKQDVASFGNPYA